MTTQRLTAVQRDVIARLQDGWELSGSVPREITKQGEAPRHIGHATLESLHWRGIIKWDGWKWKWVLVDEG